MRNPGDIVKKVAGCNAFRKRRFVEEARDKNQRHAVGVYEVGIEEKIANRRLASAHRQHLAVGGGEDERSERGAATLERNVNHELRRPYTIDHRYGQAADHNDRHVPPRFSGRIVVNASELYRHVLPAPGGAFNRQGAENEAYLAIRIKTAAPVPQLLTTWRRLA